MENPDSGIVLPFSCVSKWLQSSKFEPVKSYAFARKMNKYYVIRNRIRVKQSKRVGKIYISCMCIWYNRIAWYKILDKVNKFAINQNFPLFIRIWLSAVVKHMNLLKKKWKAEQINTRDFIYIRASDDGNVFQGR